MSNKNYHADLLICILIGSLLAAVFQAASHSHWNEGEGMWHGLNFNLAVYIGSLALSFIIFLALTAIADRIRAAAGKMADGSAQPSGTGAGKAFRAVLYLVYTGAAAALFLLIYGIYVNEPNLFPYTVATTYLRQEVPHVLYFSFIVAAVAATLFALAGRGDSSGKNMRLRITAALFLAVLNAVALYCPNMFADQAAGVPHIHAVTNSMVNVAHFKPYDAHNISIYGHYALLCLPFVKLLGNDFFAIMQTLAVMGFFTYAAAFYVASKLIRRDFVYILAILGITGTTTILTRRGQYFQVNPLRLLFPMLVLAVIAFAAYRDRGKSRVPVIALEIAAGTGSLIWNFETGLFCVAVLMCVIVFRELYQSPVFSVRTLKAVLTAMAFAGLCALGAYGIVGLYNIACGGGFNTPRLFIYPILSGNYNFNHLREALPSVVFLYFFQILLFFLTALTVLRRQFLHSMESEAAGTLYFAISLSGLSSLVYFMNRAAYGNMAISHIQMCMLLAPYGEAALELTATGIKEKLRSPLPYFGMLLTVIMYGCSLWMAIEATLYLPICLDFRANSSWKTESMIEGIEEIRAKVPEDTFAFGFCIPEIYYQLGWDNAIAMIDWSDMNEVNRQYIKQEALKHNYVLVGDAGYPSKLYRKIESVRIEPYEYSLFERVEKLPEGEEG